MNDRIRDLEREVELLNKIISLTKELEALKAKPPVYVPYVPSWPIPYDPRPIRYDPYYPTITTGSVTVSDNIHWFKV